METTLGTQVANADSDGDGCTDKAEVHSGADPRDPSSLPEPDGDGDCLSDDFERQVGSNPRSADSDKDKVKVNVMFKGREMAHVFAGDHDDRRGAAKYQRLVAICRDYGVLTPEDPYVTWPGEGPAYRLAPLFLLYDYSFRPDDIPAEGALAWAEQEGIVCADELLLHPDPYPTRETWCATRCTYTEARLQAVAGAPLILINHFPLRQDLAVLPRIPRFSLWCGTRRTDDWHLRFAAQVVIYGRLHIPGTRWRDSVRCASMACDPQRRTRAELRQ